MAVVVVYDEIVLPDVSHSSATFSFNQLSVDSTDMSAVICIASCHILCPHPISGTVTVSVTLAHPLARQVRSDIIIIIKK